MANNFALLGQSHKLDLFWHTVPRCPVVHPSARLYPLATWPLARATGALTAATPEGQANSDRNYSSVAGET